MGILRRTHDVPSNLDLAVVPVFGVDPRGAAIFAGAVNGTVGQLGSRVVLDVHDNAWTGWTQQPQTFRSAIAGNAGAGRAVVDRTTMLDQSRSSAGLSPMQVTMEQRAARGLY